MGRCINGLAVGMAIGIGVGVAMLPQMDRKTKRSIKRGRRNVMNRTEDLYDTVINLLK